MADKVLKRFRIVDPKIRANAANYIGGLNPKLHKGDLMVVVYEHVETVTGKQRRRYMAELGACAERYRRTVARVAARTGHTPEEICLALHDRSDGRLFDHQPNQGDFHDMMKKRLRGGGTTTTLTKAEFSQYADAALREAGHICDVLDTWAKRHFE